VTLLEQVTARLDAERIPYALIGAAALAAAGIARSTFDIDLLTTDRRCLVDGMCVEANVGDFPPDARERGRTLRPA
jgi:hypothetical protein